MLIDINVTSGHWPFQRFAVQTPEALHAHLTSTGITHALVSPVEAALHPDPDEYNHPLLKALSGHACLRPVPVLNPSLPGWQDRLQEYTGRYQVRAVRIMPNYHLYDLEQDCAQELADRLNAAGIPLLVQLRLEDERNQYAALKIAGVPVESVCTLANRWPALRVVCLCPFMGEAEQLVQEAPNTWVDLACVESLDTLASLLAAVPAHRVLFGSHTPFLYTRAGMAKLETANVSPDALEAVRCTNALRLFGEF